MLKHCVAFVTIALALVSIPVRAAEEPDHVIHEELRGLMRTAQQAISAGQFDDALPVLDFDHPGHDFADALRACPQSSFVRRLPAAVEVSKAS